MSIQTIIANLEWKGYKAGRKLIVYLLSQGTPKQDIIDLCLELI